ncbi:MAG: hypothetical protein ACOY3Z_09795 [Thermodesulfobacteriota bacterium]
MNNKPLQTASPDGLGELACAFGGVEEKPPARPVLLLACLLGWCLLWGSPASAITPCPDNPCLTDAQAECDQLADWVAEGVLVELRYRSDVAKPTIIPGFPAYQTLPREMIFLPDRAVIGEAPPGEITLTPYRICWPVPALQDLRPVRLRVFVRQTEQGGKLVHFERLPR